MQILITPTFERAVKKLHKQQKIALDEAVRTIVSQPVSLIEIKKPPMVEFMAPLFK